MQLLLRCRCGGVARTGGGSLGPLSLSTVPRRVHTSTSQMHAPLVTLSPALRHERGQRQRKHQRHQPHRRRLLRFDPFRIRLLATRSDIHASPCSYANSNGRAVHLPDSLLSAVVVLTPPSWPIPQGAAPQHGPCCNCELVAESAMSVIDLERIEWSRSWINEPNPRARCVCDPKNRTGPALC